MSNILSRLSILLLLSRSAHAGTAWFGLGLPSDSEQRIERDWAVYRNPDLPPLGLRPPADNGPYRAITGKEIYQYLTDITRITEENRPLNEKYWGRIAGSRAERETARYLAEKLSAFGLRDVRLETVKGGPQWWPADWRVTLLADPAYGDGTQDYVFTSAFPAVQLGKGAMQVDKLEAALVYAGLGQPVDLLGKDLTGKIAVVRSILQIDPFFQTARGHIDDLVQAGAVAVIVAVDGPGNLQYALENLGSTEVPCLLLGGEDGRFLLSALAAAQARPLKMRVMMKSELRDGWESENALGLLPGKNDEYVLVTAHLDGYFHAANDNGGGVAALLALARHFSAASASKLNRHHLFIGTSAHHEFSDGVQNFIATHPELMARTQLVVNIEHPSSIYSYYRGPLQLDRATVPGQLNVTTGQGTRALSVSNGNPQLVSIYREAINRYGMVVDATVNRRPTGDAFDFFRAGLPVVQIIDANLWFHSSGDRIETIDRDGLERAVRLYAEVLERIDQATAAELGLGHRP